MQELLAIPDSVRTDAEWDELNELEISLAAVNREGAPPPRTHASPKRRGQPQQQRQHQHQHVRPAGPAPAAAPGGAKKAGGKKFHKRPHKGPKPGGEGGGPKEGGTPPSEGSAS